MGCPSGHQDYLHRPMRGLPVHDSRAGHDSSAGCDTVGVPAEGSAQDETFRKSSRCFWEGGIITTETLMETETVEASATFSTPQRSLAAVRNPFLLEFFRAGVSRWDISLRPQYIAQQNVTCLPTEKSL